MPCTAESCRDGLTRKCFEECPEWAKQAFAYRLLHTLLRAEITRRLPKGLREALISPGVEVPPGIVFPPGTTISPGTAFPPGWAPADPLPSGALQSPQKMEATKLSRESGMTTTPITLSVSAGALGGGGRNVGGTGGAGCGCCRNKDNPAEFVSIGYEAAEMELSADQELTVSNQNEWCEGHFYEWMITKGGGELSIGEGLSVIYTAPASGHGCPVNTEITLFCCGEVMDTLDIVINYNYAIEYDYATSAETIARETSELIYVTANNTPLTWAVEGIGFSLEHTETDGCGNVLHADETACGVATITITGCDGQVATGEVRCTTGRWVSIYACGDAQPFGCTVIKGKYKVRAYCKYTTWPTPPCEGIPDPPCDLLCPNSLCVEGVPCHQAGDYYYYVSYSQKWEWQCPA